MDCLRSIRKLARNQNHSLVMHKGLRFRHLQLLDLLTEAFYISRSIFINNGLSTNDTSQTQKSLLRCKTLTPLSSQDSSILKPHINHLWKEGHTLTLFLIFLARWANLSVLNVSSAQLQCRENLIIPFIWVLIITQAWFQIANDDLGRTQKQMFQVWQLWNSFFVKENKSWQHTSLRG